MFFCDFGRYGGEDGFIIILDDCVDKLRFIGDANNPSVSHSLDSSLYTRELYLKGGERGYSEIFFKFKRVSHL